MKEGESVLFFMLIWRQLHDSFFSYYIHLTIASLKLFLFKKIDNVIEVKFFVGWNPNKQLC